MLEASASAQLGRRIPLLLKQTHWALVTCFAFAVVTNAVLIVSRIVTETRKPSPPAHLVEQIVDTVLMVGIAYWFFRLARVTRRVISSTTEHRLDFLVAELGTFLLYDAVVMIATKLMQSHQAGLLAASAIGTVALTAGVDNVKRLSRLAIIDIVATLCALGLAAADLTRVAPGDERELAFVFELVLNLFVLLVTGTLTSAAMRYCKTPGSEPLIGVVSAIRRFWVTSALVQGVVMFYASLSLYALVQV